MWELIGLVTDLFRMRVGLPVGMYGKNEDGTQNRSAEETVAKNRMYESRPQFMQKAIVDVQGRLACGEAMIASRFIRSQHVAPRLGPTLASWWDRVVASEDDEVIARQYSYTVDAASIRRPNRDRDVANLQQVATIWLPVAMGAAQASGNYDACNGMMTKWGEMHDQDMTGMMIPGQSEEMQQAQQQAQQLEQQKMEMEAAKMQAEIQGKQMDVQAKQMDAQIKQETAQADLQIKAAEMQMDAQQQQQEMEFDARKAQLEIEMESGKGVMQILMERQKHQQKMQQDAQQGAVKMATAVQGAQVQGAVAKQKAKSQIDVQRAKAAQAKKQAKQKPKPQGKK
jgi:hypothetical protein